MKMIIKITFLITMSLNIANASSLPQSNFVKIKTYPCQLMEPVLNGSGVIVKHNNSYKVLTSDHVIYNNSSQKTCVDVENKLLKIERITNQRLSILKGLSVFDLNNSEVEKVVTKPFIISKEQISIDNIKQAMAVGFPAGANRLRVLGNGEVLTHSSQRALLPGINNMIELANMPLEFGMSGGGLVFEDSDGNYQLAGILSHQYLSRQPGVSTVNSVMSMSSQIFSTDLSLAIPAFEAFKWLDDKVNGVELKWSRSVKPSGSSYSMGNIIFETKPIDSTHIHYGGSDPTGVGGEDDSPILVGGKNIITISIERGESLSGEFPQKYAIIERWKDLLLRGHKISILKMTKLIDGQYDIKNIINFEQVLTLWLRDGYQPIVHIGQSGDIDNQFNLRETKYNKLLEIIEQIQSSIKFSKIEDKGALVSWLKLIESETLMVSNFIINPNNLYKIFDNNNDVYWQALYTHDFDKSVELATLLRKFSIVDTGDEK